MPSTEIKGLDNALQRMKALPEKMRKKMVSSALRKGAAIVRKDAVARAKRFDDPKTPSKVYKEIVTRTNGKLGKREGGVAIQVGVKGGAKRYKDNKENRRKGKVGVAYEGPGAVYYWRFLEFGTSKMKAQPFMRPALENNVDKVISTVTAELSNQLDKET